MSRYVSLTLSRVTVQPVEDNQGAMLDLAVTEVGYPSGMHKERMLIYCDNWHFKRVISSLRKFSSTLEWQASKSRDSRLLKELAKSEPALPKIKFRYLPSIPLPERGGRIISHYTLHNTEIGYGGGRYFSTVGFLHLETDFEDIPIQLARDAATKFAKFLE